MLIAPDFARAIEGKVRRKKNITGKISYQVLRDKARRLCGYSPEVMVRITSYGQGAGNARANLGYISRIDVPDKADLALENERGDIIAGAENIDAYAYGWEQDFGKPHKQRRDTLRMILSMPAGTNAEAVRDATRSFAAQVFGNHEYVFVLHTDEPHPHCHLTVKMLGFDGKRLNPRKDDLADWREVFAQALRKQGVQAEATRRAARGVVLKAEKSVVRHIDNSVRKGKQRVSKAVAGRERDAAAALTAEQLGQPLVPGPWEARIRAEQAAVRAAWLAAAEVLGQGPVRSVFAPVVVPASPAQLAGAVVQARLAVRPAGGPPRPVMALASLPTLPRAPAGRPPVQFKQPRPFPVRSLASLSPPGAVRAGSPPVFQEIPHERPSRTQHAAAVYQSHLATAGQRAAHAHASLRQLPRLDVVLDRPIEVLLQPDARRRLGFGAAAGDGVRRAGTGLAGDRAGTGRAADPAAGAGAAGSAGTGPERGVGTLAGLLKLADLPSSVAADQALAAGIRAFVAGMPAVETQRDVLKRRLAAQFPAVAPVPAAAPGQEKGADQAAPQGKVLGL